MPNQTVAAPGAPADAFTAPTSYAALAVITQLPAAAPPQDTATTHEPPAIARSAPLPASAYSAAPRAGRHGGRLSTRAAADKSKPAPVPFPSGPPAKGRNQTVGAPSQSTYAPPAPPSAPAAMAVTGPAHGSADHMGTGGVEESVYRADVHSVYGSSRACADAPRASTESAAARDIVH